MDILCFSHETTKICRGSYFVEGAIAMSKCQWVYMDTWGRGSSDSKCT